SIDHRGSEAAAHEAEPDHPLRRPLGVDDVRETNTPPVSIEHVDVRRPAREQGPCAPGQEAAPRSFELRVSLAYVGGIRAALGPLIALDVGPDRNVTGDGGVRGDLAAHAEV